MDMEQRKADGLIWGDTKDSLSQQIFAKELLHKYNNLSPSQVEDRSALIQKMFGSVGEKVWIEQPLAYATGKNTTIGDRVYINSGLTLVDDWKITIGNNVLIAPNVTIITTGHPLHRQLRQNGEMYSFPVKIKDWAWIGANVTILPGVTIGEGAVIGAGSVVTKDIPDSTLAYGNPCKIIREISDCDKELYYRDRKVDEEWLSRDDSDKK